MGPSQGACPACGAACDPGARFCSQCGGEITGRCSACEAELPAGARFCPACGAPVPEAAAARPEPAGREGRKVVTALFADVVGSTALGERFDPEDYRSVVGEAVARMVAAVEEFGGSVQDLAGDGILALYGVPAAHEDDAERACLSGLRILEAIGGYADEVEERWGVEGFAVRIGIETGLAVLAPVGGGGKVELGAMGDVLNTAARLEASADPGSVLVGPLTQQLVEPLFGWDPARALELKGKAELVTAYPLRAVRPRAERRHDAEGAEARLVGREEELALAEEALADLLAGRGGILLVDGEAGIGKTRLLRELGTLFERRRGGEGPGTWLHGRCVSYAESIPYLPLRGLLRDWLDAGGGLETRVALRDRAAKLLGERAEELTPLLTSLLGAGTSEEERSGLEALSPEARQVRTQEALQALLVSLAGEGPVVISLDDLHWGDAATLRLLEGLLPCTDEAAILIVLAMRREPGHGCWRVSETARRELPHRTRAIGLSPLREGSDRGLLAALAGEGTLPEGLERELLERAAGNPFYLEQLVHSLVDSGALVREGEGWRFEGTAELELPPTVERVILARVDRLPPASQDLLGAASVLGREFGLPLLAALTTEGQSASKALRELLRAELVREIGRRPEPRYRFRHQMIQEVVYGSLLRERRRELHARAADSLERLLGDGVEDHLGVLARHCDAAGQAERAFDYHRRAADAAWQLYAREEAMEHYTGALEAAERMDERPAARLLRELRRARATLAVWGGDIDRGHRELRAVLIEAREAGDRREEIETLRGLAHASKGHGVGTGLREAMGWLEEALAIAREIGDPAAEVLVLNPLALCYANGARFDRGLQVSRRALALAREAGDEELIARALDGLKLNLLSLGNVAELEHACAELERIVEARGDRELLQWVLLEGAFVHIARADWEPAASRLDAALKLNRRTAGRLGEPLFLDAICWMHRSRGAPGPALAAGREALALARDLDLLHWQAWTAATLGSTLLDLHAAEAAAPVLAPGLEAAERVGMPDQTIRCTGQLALAEMMRGRSEEAAELADRGETLLGAIGAPPGEVFLLGADAYLALAQVRLVQGGPERARELAGPLLDAARRHGWLEAVAGAASLIARCAAAEGDRDQAVALLHEAIAAAGEDRLPTACWQAHAILAEIERAGGDQAEAERHRTRSRAIVERLASGIGETELREGFLDRALSVGRDRVGSSERP